MDITPEDLKIVRQILLNNLVAPVTVWVFGSRAQGPAKKFSDLDLLIDTGKPIPSELITALASDFEESDLPYKVDILDKTAVDESFLNIIKETAQRLI